MLKLNKSIRGISFYSRFRSLIVSLMSVILLGTSANAEIFKVVESQLFYDTDTDSDVSEIDWGHEKQLLTILKQNPEIHTLVLKSSGGLISVANEMANIVIDAGLDTLVVENCESACVTIFIAGNNRKLELGGKIGFHSSWWSAEDMKQYYEDEKEHEGWNSPFEFASWLYEDTQAAIYEEFEYLIERGVKPNFAIQTLKAGADGMWYPRRKQLLEGGILTE